MASALVVIRTTREEREEELHIIHCVIVDVHVSLDVNAAV